MLVCGKVNFTNLSRYSNLKEKTYRRQFGGAVDFVKMNLTLAVEDIPLTHTMVAAMDCSFVSKSGKATVGVDGFYNGTHAKVEQGLEVSLIALVDVEAQLAYSLSVSQTVASAEFPELNRMDQYIDQLEQTRPQLPPQVGYLVADGFYAKLCFLVSVLALELHLISKLRKDADLRYVFTGEQKKRGAPRKYDGKVDLSDPSRFEFVKEVEAGVKLYTAVVWHVALKHQIRIAYLLNCTKPAKISYVVLFSTDVTLSADDIYRFYKSRFQIEFIFRDAKQFTGLSDCQARDAKKLDFHFNAALTTLNLAKFQAHQQHSGTDLFVFSMASVKRRAFNDYLLESFISMFDLEPTSIKSHPNYQKLQSLRAISP